MTQSFDAAIAAFSPALPLAVGLSGGADSTALLLACAQKWPGQVQAIHVHHGLQAAADGFEHHCQVLCERLQVPLTVQRVDARHAPGESPEDAARQARYKAFEAAAQSSQAQNAIYSIACSACWLSLRGCFHPKKGPFGCRLFWFTGGGFSAVPGGHG